MRHLKKRVLQDRREKALLIGSSALSGRIGRSSQRRRAVFQELQIFPKNVAPLSIIEHIAREQHLFFDHIHQSGIVRDQPCQEKIVVGQTPGRVGDDERRPAIPVFPRGGKNPCRQNAPRPRCGLSEAYSPLFWQR